MADGKVVRVYTPEWNFKSFFVGKSMGFRELRDQVHAKLKLDKSAVNTYCFYHTSDIFDSKVIDLNAMVLEYCATNTKADGSFKVVHAPTGFPPPMTFVAYQKKLADSTQAIAVSEKSGKKKEKEKADSAGAFRPILPGQANRRTAAASTALTSDTPRGGLSSRATPGQLVCYKSVDTGAANAEEDNGGEDSDETEDDSNEGEVMKVSQPSPPPQPQKPNVTLVIALHDCTVGKENVLKFRKGDIIELVRRVNENWSYGRLNGVSGMFPQPYVKPYVEVKPPSAVPSLKLPGNQDDPAKLENNVVKPCASKNDEEMNLTALEEQQAAAIEALNDSCIDLLMQKKRIVLSEQLKKLSPKLPIAISETLVFQLLAGMKAQIEPEEMSPVKKEYQLLYEAFLEYQREMNELKAKILSEVSPLLPPNTQLDFEAADDVFLGY